jgi:hypothetical protein
MGFGIFKKPLKKTIHWYKNYNQSKIVNTEFDLNEYILEATKAQLIWTK